MKSMSRILAFFLFLFISLVYAAKEPIPDLNIPLIDENFITSNDEAHDRTQIQQKSSLNKRRKKELHEMSNKNHESIKVMSPNIKQITIDDKVLYSDTQRTKWREKKRKYRKKIKNETPIEQLRERWKLNQRKYRATLSDAKKKEARNRYFAKKHGRMAKIQHAPVESKDDKMA